MPPKAGINGNIWASFVTKHLIRHHKGRQRCKTEASPAKTDMTQSFKTCCLAPRKHQASPSSAPLCALTNTQNLAHDWLQHPDGVQMRVCCTHHRLGHLCLSGHWSYSVEMVEFSTCPASCTCSSSSSISSYHQSQQCQWCSSEASTLPHPTPFFSVASVAPCVRQQPHLRPQRALAPCPGVRVLRQCLSP